MKNTWMVRNELSGFHVSTNRLYYVNWSLTQLMIDFRLLKGSNFGEKVIHSRKLILAKNL